MKSESLTLGHFAQLLVFQDCTKKFCQLSAGKQKLINELVALNLLRIDTEDESFIYLTEYGTTVISYVEEKFKHASIIYSP